MTSSEQIEFYWRPGCIFCMMLERKLKLNAVPFEKLNIWENAEHASFVRSVASGSETVPTVRVGHVSLVNPRIKDVLEAVAQHAPDLIEPARRPIL